MRCRIKTCEHYSPPYHTFFPGCIWAPVFDAPRKIRACFEANIQRARALYERSTEIIATMQSCIHQRYYVFEEAGFRFGIDCADPLCTQARRILLAGSPLEKLEEDLRDLFMASTHLKHRYTHQFKPLRDALRGSSPLTSDALCVRISCKYLYNRYEYCAEDAPGWKTHLIHEKNVSSLRFLELFLNPNITSLEIVTEACAIHGGELDP